MSNYCSLEADGIKADNSIGVDIASLGTAEIFGPLQVGTTACAIQTPSSFHAYILFSDFIRTRSCCSVVTTHKTKLSENGTSHEAECAICSRKHAPSAKIRIPRRTLSNERSKKHINHPSNWGNLLWRVPSTRTPY